MKKILSIIGARPQFIKASVVLSKAIAKSEKLTEVIIHTGQHFDENMSNIFFEQLEIPRPHYLLNINGGDHGNMTGRMIIDIENILQKESPDCVIVYGDTNSTLAGALAAVKLQIPIIHIESGLRSFNMQMPEEINRIMTDRVSSVLFCPTEISISNLKKEGYPFLTTSGKKQEIINVGDVMQDSVILFSKQSTQPKKLNVSDNFLIATIHRAENTNNLVKLLNILDALNNIAKEEIQVILPIHPRTQNIIQNNNIDVSYIIIIDPVGYLEMLWLLKNSALVVTDSGGLQKEAFFTGKACVTIRDQTEWVELVDIGVNQLVGTNKEDIVKSIRRNLSRRIIDKKDLYGGGKASEKIFCFLEKYL